MAELEALGRVAAMYFAVVGLLLHIAGMWVVLTLWRRVARGMKEGRTAT